jgi:hypothetical protein
MVQRKYLNMKHDTIFRRYIKKILWYLLNKLEDNLKIKKLDIQTNSNFEVLCPPDGKFHHFAVTIDFFIKRDVKDYEQIERKKYFLDGQHHSDTITESKGYVN